MKKKDLLKRLNKLTKLIAKTEPDIEPDTHLFSQHSITHEKNIMRIQEERYTQREMVNLMEESNHIWTIRNKIHNGEWDVLPLVQLEKEVKDFISQGQKINAIKHYRNVMDRDFGTTMSLKIAKYTIDALAQNIQVDLTKGYNKAV
tara:strand:+ start:5329 stop:5766 length:438 start_codon:yes stop_codon:yes gene_type:complete